MALLPSFIPGADRINSAVRTFFEGGQAGMPSIRSVNYAKSYLWTLDFIDGGEYSPPAPFDQFFPASDVQIPMAILNTDTIRFGQSDIKVPISTSAKELTITFYDDEQRTLLNWMREWINLDILNDGQFMSGLEDTHQTVNASVISGKKRAVKPVRTLRLALLQHYKKEVISFEYGIFPTGQIDFNGSQASEATSYTMTFVIAEDLAKKAAPKSEGFTFNDVKQLLGRFF